jgi:uncharacterized phiE125 gp8 family phage protein
MSLTLVTPAEMPVTVEEVRANSRIDGTADDDLIEGLIAAAVSYIESWTSRKFAPATWDYTADAFPTGAIYLPLSPVASVASIAYADANSDPQVVTGYTVDGVALSLAGGWPTGSSVVVRFVAGDGVPAAVKQAVLLLVGHWYENRETASDKALPEIPMGAHALLNLHRQMFV